MKFRVWFTAPTTSRCWVEVEASDTEAAKDAAKADLARGVNVDWAADAPAKDEIEVDRVVDLSTGTRSRS